MGGSDKGLLEYRGRPLVAYAADVLRPQVDHLLVVANRNADRYRAFADDVFPDLAEGFLGPLAGMASALSHATSDWVLCVPCDAPCLPENLAARLCAQALREGVKVAVPHDGCRVHPVICLLNRSCLPSLHECLRQHRFQVKAWLEEQPATIVDYGDCPWRFKNINTPADIRALKQSGDSLC